jgi:tRNA pseudouridine55 synthase
MARKQTYRHKNAEKIDQLGTQPLPFVQLSQEQKETFLEGQTLLIDKPLHWTSFDAVRKIRSSIGIKKVGHAGTLDPLATGLLIICTGKNTKQINQYMAQTKEYTGTITLGAVTPTYDLESLPEQPKPYGHITTQQLHNLCNTFIGPIMQKPPIYAAIKKDGEALYELARRGEDVELVPRPITIYSFELTQIELPNLHFKVSCSTGTYIRSLAHDYGQALQCGAHLSALRRTKIGNFSVDTAQTIHGFLTQLQTTSK